MSVAWRFFCSVALASASGLVSVPGARADITVTGPFATPNDGLCSLDEALSAAITPGSPSSECPGAVVGGTTTIHLPAGTYVAQTTHVPSGTAIAIVGAGADASQSSVTSFADRWLDLAAGATVALTDMRIFGSTADNGHVGTTGNGAVGSAGANGGVGAAGGAGGAGGNGLPAGDGGGVRNAGTLTVTNVIFDQDSAGHGGMGGAGGTGGSGGPRDPASSVSPSGGSGGQGGNGAAAGSGGAIANSGTLTVAHSIFSNDSAGGGGIGGVGGFGGVGGSPSGTAFLGGQGGPGGSGGGGGGVGGDGGAILNTGTATISDTVFSDDHAGRGGSPGTGGKGGPGYSVPSGDQATFAGPGGSGGSPGIGGSAAGGNGGAIYSTGTLHLTGVTIQNGAAGQGGSGGTGGAGGDGGTGFADRGGTGGTGAPGVAAAVGGRGGGIYATGGTVTVDSSTIALSHGGQGGQGGFGGDAGSGGSSSVLSGAGGSGGNAAIAGNGGAIAFTGAVVTITNSTLSRDTAGLGGTGGRGGNSPSVQTLPGAGGSGGNGGSGGSGGGIFAILGGSGKADLQNATVALDATGAPGNGGAGGTGNPAGATGSTGTAAIYGGLAETGASGASQVKLTDTLVASNTAKNCLGMVDGGHNLSFGDATCPGISGDPKVGEVQDNGGSAPTQGLGTGSAALDAGAGCPATDERGVTRPQGAACDIGAFERGAPPVCQDLTVHVDYATTTNIPTGCIDPTGAPTTIVIDTNPAHGGAIGSTSGAGGLIQFNSPAGFVGPDSLTFHGQTGDGASAVKTAAIVVDPPPAPTLDTVAPASPAGTRSPHFTGTAPAGTTVQLFTTSDCSGTPAATGTPAAFASPGIVVSVPADSTTAVRAAYVDGSMAKSACSTSVTYVEDETAPDTIIDGGPSDTTTEPEPTFTYHASETAASFACSLDQGTPAFTVCPAAGFTPALPLAPGAYTFRVRATDLVGLTDASPATRTFTVASPTPTPTATPSATATSTPSATATSTPSATATATSSPTVSPTPTPTTAFAPALTIRGKTATIRTRKGGLAKLSLRAANAGTAADTLKLKGPARKAGAKLRYRLGGKTVTKSVSKGRLSLKLAPGAAKLITVTVKPIRRTVKLAFTARSTGDPAAKATARQTIKPRSRAARLGALVASLAGIAGP